MSDTGDFELFSGPQPSEKREMSDEQFREEMRKTQAALTQLWQEEGKSRAQDFNLAQIIIQFLSQPENTDLFLLVSRVVAQDIPSELILAVISLTDPVAAKQIKSLLAGKPTRALTVAPMSSMESLSPESKKEIDQWIMAISLAAHEKPRRSLESLLKKKRVETGAPAVYELSSVLVQLGAFVLRNYLARQNFSPDFEKLHDFMQAVFVDLVKKLEAAAQEQKRIGPSE
ncbi:hypothetical protein JXA05_04300 [Candidatus Peregrinibacteria bacterium]|nr:hypothetical protein [Candidatus Peregrinibacteria bacterium]